MKRLGLLLAVILGVGVAAPVFAQSVGASDQEIQGFFLPGGGSKAYRVHAARTTMGLQLAHGNITALGGYKVPLTFAHGARSAAGASNSPAPIAGTIGAAFPLQDGVFYQPAPTPGSILAIAIAASTALTTGTATAEATVLEQAGGAGTVRGTGFTVALDAGTGYTRYRAATQARGRTTFTDGDALGCRLSTSSDLAPLTAELACTIIVEM